MSSVDPLQFVTVRCQYCGTFYRLTPGKLEEGRTCPKCNKTQRGSLSIIGAPLSRAALASSHRVLIIRSKKHRGKKLLLPDKEVMIGSDEDCDIRDESEQISPKHCVLRPEPDGLHVRDLGSETGTYVNRVAIKEDTLIKPGELLRVGSMLFQLAGKEWQEEDAARTKRKSRREGKKLETLVYKSTKTVPAEAASVIQQHWESDRGKQEVTEWVEDED